MWLARPMTAAMRYMASLSLLFLGIGLLAMQIPLLDGWNDNLGRYAAETRTYSGPCAVAHAMDAGDARDSAINDNCGGSREIWEWLPWMLGIGLTVATLAIGCPWTYWFDY